MYNNFMIFGFPIYLIIFEMLFRSVSNLDTSAFIGPTLAATGLSFLLPLIKPKRVDLNLKKEEIFQQKGVIIRNANDERLIPVIYAFILIGILVWYWSCVTSFLNPGDMIWFFPKHLIIGLINYTFGILLTTIKEII